MIEITRIMGAVTALGLMSGAAFAQQLEKMGGQTVVGVDISAGVGESIAFSVDGDEFNDLEITVFDGAGFEDFLMNGGGGELGEIVEGASPILEFEEVAIIQSLESQSGDTIVLPALGEEEFGLAQGFQAGDPIGGSEFVFLGLPFLVLYAEGTPIDAVERLSQGREGSELFTGEEISNLEVIEEEPTISFGPIANPGDTAFIGFEQFRGGEREKGGVFAGFLEITRGSVSVSTIGIANDPFTQATAQSAAAVPLPAPLALLGFGVAALFGLRRFKA